jgi:hypothetical protein
VLGDGEHCKSIDTGDDVLAMFMLIVNIQDMVEEGLLLNAILIFLINFYLIEF